MRYPALPIVFTIALLTSACGCITDSAASAPVIPTRATADAKKQDEARVAAAWQDKMLAMLAKDSAAIDAYGLFSEGGWSDAGQVIVLVGGGAPRLAVADSNRQEVSRERPLTDAEWKALSPQIAASAKLADVDVQGFDHLTWEFVHAHKDGEKVTVADRVFISNPGVKEIPEHDALVAAFQAFRKPAAK